MWERLDFHFLTFRFMWKCVLWIHTHNWSNGVPMGIEPNSHQQAWFLTCSSNILRTQRIQMSNFYHLSAREWLSIYLKYRWVPLYPNMDNPNSQKIWSPLQTHLSLQLLICPKIWQFIWYQFFFNSPRGTCKTLSSVSFCWKLECWGSIGCGTPCAAPGCMPRLKTHFPLSTVLLNLPAAFLAYCHLDGSTCSLNLPWWAQPLPGDQCLNGKSLSSFATWFYPINNVQASPG